MSKLWKSIKKNWIRVWLIIVIAILSTTITFAAYTEVSSVKRVVSTTASPGEPFSSNCMMTNISSRRLTSSEFPVSVCNFDQNFPKDYSTTKITYQVTAELKIKINNQYYGISELETLKSNGTITQADYDKYIAKVPNYSVCKLEDDKDGTIASVEWKTFTADNNYTVTFDEDELKANRSSTDIYSVKIDPADLESEDALFYVYVTAKPQSGTLSELSARLYGTADKTDKGVLWSGSILEQNCDTVDYDFYNYIITGSGKGTIEVSWDPNYLKANKFFIEENGLTETNGENGWKKIIISADSTVKSRYEIQFYKTEEDKSMTSPDTYIKCKFTKEDAS